MIPSSQSPNFISNSSMQQMTMLHGLPQLARVSGPRSVDVLTMHGHVVAVFVATTIDRLRIVVDIIEPFCFVVVSRSWLEVGLLVVIETDRHPLRVVHASTAEIGQENTLIS